MIINKIISIVVLITTNFVFTQSAIDSLKKNYEEKLTGFWVRQNEFIDGRGAQKDTIVYSYDTLRFSLNLNYYHCQGANTDRKWTGVIDSGTCEIYSSNDSTFNINFYQKYSNLPLPLTNYTYFVTELNETELHFIYYNRTFIYRRYE